LDKTKNTPFYLGITGLLLVAFAHKIDSFLELLPKELINYFFENPIWYLALYLIPGAGAITGLRALYLYFKSRPDREWKSHSQVRRLLNITGFISGVIAVLFGSYIVNFYFQI
jgi:hypothetical protein